MVSHSAKFGKYLEQKRISLKLTQVKLAGLCKIDRTYFHIIEKTGKMPSLIVALKISNFLKDNRLLKIYLEEKYPQETKILKFLNARR